MSSPVASCGIAVMAKASVPGRAKTRLAPPLTLDEAATFNTAFLKDVAANLGATAADGASVAGYMAYGPPGSEDFFERIMPSGIGLFEVWFPNFGDCLFAAASALFDRGHAAACVLNADSPTLPTELLVETAAVLARPGDRVVLGPSSDGGYYLLGVKHPHRRLFDEIDWSTERVAGQTLDRAAELRLSVHVLPTWYDVDDVAALRTLHGEVFDGRSFDPDLTPNAAAHTAALFEELLRTTDLADRLGLQGAAGTEAARPDVAPSCAG